MDDNSFFLDYEEIQNKNFLNQIFEKFDLIERLKLANYVVIKPNLAAGTYVKSDSHVVTDLQLMGILVEYILTIAPQKEIYIAESDSTGFGFAFLKFSNLRLPESLRISKYALEHVKLLDMSRDMLMYIENEKFEYFTNYDKQLWLSKTLLEADFIIDITNLKSHSVTGFTGACKNLFGTLHTSEKWIFHTHISQILHDLVLAVKPDLSIVDAFYGMEYNGPVAGKKINAGFRVWSTDPVVADIISCYMAGFQYKKIKYLKRLIHTTRVDANQILLNCNINKMCSFHPPVLFLRITNTVGLVLQRVGESIQYFGHRIHVTQNLLQLLVAITRPCLMAVFGKERLVQIKQKILKN